MSEGKNTEYLDQRLKELGITDKLNTFTRVWTNTVSSKNDNGETVTTEHENTREYKIFDADEHGNIVIHYFDLNGQPYRWKKEDTKQTRDYVRLRLREPKGEMKYVQPSGSPLFPFFPPAIIEKFKKAEEIQVLYLIEGEFKSFVGSMHNMDIVGLPGIFGFYNGDIKGKLHEDIQELIIRCKVHKIVLINDADLLSVKWTEGKDLAKRPMSFFGSIKSFRESLQLLLDDKSVKLDLVYFMHINTKFMNDAKGLDDLLVKYQEKCVEIIEDICALNFAKKYFTGFSLASISHDVQGRIYKYLGLIDEQEFYKTYSDFIGAREFRFKRRSYVYDQEKKEVVFVKHEDADKFMRIGPDWVKVITKLNKYGEPEEEIIPWKISEIIRDYKKYPDFLNQVQKYDDFINEPAWNGNYKRVHNNCFNICNPLNWQPKQGPVPTTVKFLKHIFQGSGQLILDDKGHYEREDAIQGDSFTVALDYLTILLKHPKHMLPVPILVSPENNTGKSTFLKWLQLIFGSNMCILGNEQFKMKFNAHYISKFIIAIDEGFLEVDKKAEKERLKQLVTADSAFLEHKGMNIKKINYYGKLIISSNDADRVMKIEDGESRWFVVRVPVITEKDPDMEKKLKDEVEAFLHFIHNRQIFHPRTDRLWFKPEWFITDQFRIIVETTKNRVDRVFEDWIQEQFMLYRLPVLRYPMKFLTEVFNDPKNSKFRIDAIELKAYLTKKGLKPDILPHRIRIPIGYNVSDDVTLPIEPTIIYQNPVARPYSFKVEEWLSPEQLEEFKKPMGSLSTMLQNGQPKDVPGPTFGVKKDELPF